MAPGGSAPGARELPRLRVLPRPPCCLLPAAYALLGSLLLLRPPTSQRDEGLDAVLQHDFQPHHAHQERQDIARDDEVARGRFPLEALQRVVHSPDDVREPKKPCDEIHDEQQDVVHEVGLGVLRQDLHEEPAVVQEEVAAFAEIAGCRRPQQEAMQMRRGEELQRGLGAHSDMTRKEYDVVRENGHAHELKAVAQRICEEVAHASLHREAPKLEELFVKLGGRRV
mmetsp:Transcript_13820/g.51571  ORF Transcript_13820/g.51571 Transcript_13820/m.51571 type:complete len:226 (+) Transcript_13820:41-718(+)